jgi:hypothetical protein
MINTYTSGDRLVRCLRRLGLTALLASSAALAGQAQTLNYAASSVVNTAGTYTDLGTTGTAITTANTDDANSAPQNIGFTFTYNGTDFTQFVFNTNGVVRLGSAAPSTAALYYDNSGLSGVDPLQSVELADVNLLMPFNIDLVPGSNAAGASYRMLTSGSAPNRVCTIQWRNVADKAGVGADARNGTQYANFSFQLKLYETTNTIEFVYDQAEASSAAAGQRFPNVGLKGSGLTAGQMTLALKNVNSEWSTTTFQNANYGTNNHDITKGIRPDAGRTYRFVAVPPVPNDIAIKGVYALGKIAAPASVPQAVQVFVANQGTATQTNVAFTLTIAGANTYTFTGTVPSIGAGQQTFLTFPAEPATLSPGTNTITVSVPADGNNTNNAVSISQLVTTDRLSYIEPGKPTDGALSGGAGSTLLTKYTVSSTVSLSNAVISFANVTGGLTTAFQVVVYDATGSNATPGNVLYTSPTQNRPATGGDVTVALPALQLNNSFYVGIIEVGTTGSGIATQSESPLRPTTFYYSANSAAPWIDIAATLTQRRLAIEVGLTPITCAAPTNLSITSATTTSAVLAFTDASNAGSYQVVYGPVGFQPATAGTTINATASPVTLTGLQPGATYQVYVRTNCAGGGSSLYAGPLSFSTGCNAATAIATFPYTEGFESIPVGQALPCGFTVLDANNDKATWAITKSTPYAGVNALRYAGVTLNNVAADDWFFTPALTLAANTRYQLAFRYRGEGIAPTPSSYTEKLEVKAGPTATPAGQTTTLFTNAAITNTTYTLANATSTPAVAVLQPGAGTQYVGFHVYSDANQGNLYIDDISLTSAVGLATSDAMMRAVTVFPNPSTTGVFDLEIHGANAQKGLEVEVVNNLGQRVYVGTARDNFTNRLDLSTLATGLYHLKVRAGDDYMLRQISIVK